MLSSRYWESEIMHWTLQLAMVCAVVAIAMTHNPPEALGLDGDACCEGSEGRWCEPVKALAGRLRVALEDLHPARRFAVFLELKNLSVEPVAITNQPRIHAELADATGKTVPTSGSSAGAPKPARQWAMIPRDAYLGLRIDMQATGVPTRQPNVTLLALGAQTWELVPGRYRLKVLAAFVHEEKAPAGQWSGELGLPPVEVLVPPALPTA
jgi:hypothetical protein